MSTAKQGDVVRVHYTGRLLSGEQFDSSIGRSPLEFTVGEGQMIAGFDAGVVGMAIGDKKVLTIAAADGYGEWDEENTIPFAKENLPPDLQIELGMELTMRNSDGQPFNVTVGKILDDAIILDANHALAGKELIFDVELVELNPGVSRIIMP
ncbi:peptidylprolyl isomerase [soil metagenome]